MLRSTRGDTSPAAHPPSPAPQDWARVIPMVCSRSWTAISRLGQGTLIITGDLTLDGNFNWNGVIMVLGTGHVYRSGGGHGNIYGAMFVAKFPASGADSDKFGAPVFDTSGGGTSNIQYSSDAVDKAKSVGGHSVKGIREY